MAEESSTTTRASSKAKAEDKPATYRKIELHPGMFIYQSLLTGHTEDTEAEMIRYHASLPGAGIATH